jgi:hypothetical protein
VERSERSERFLLDTPIEKSGKMEGIAYAEEFVLFGGGDAGVGG